jgi:peptidoglycan/LPS O-acetylase OafA/YrhL
VAARFAGSPPPAVLPYFVRRAARIVPGYWVALLAVSIWFSHSYVFTPGGLIRYFGFLQIYGNHTTAGGGISVAWTLCVEVTFYAVLPLLALGARRVGQRRSVLASELIVCGLMVLLSLIWQVAITIAVPESNSWFLSVLAWLPGSLDLFAAGMALAVLSVEDEHRAVPRRVVGVIARRPWLPWLLALGVLYGEGQIPAHVGITGWWLSTHALKLIGCALLLAPAVLGVEGRGLFRRVVGARPFVWLGTVSYGIYLWHYPVLGKLAPHLVPHGEFETTIVMLAISIAIGALSYYIVERPAQVLARRYLARRRERAGVIAPVVVAPPEHR